MCQLRKFKDKPFVPSKIVTSFLNNKDLSKPNKFKYLEGW